jgi:hypothetical protein
LRHVLEKEGFSLFFCIAHVGANPIIMNQANQMIRTIAVLWLVIVVMYLAGTYHDATQVTSMPSDAQTMGLLAAWKHHLIGSLKATWWVLGLFGVLSLIALGVARRGK